MLEKIREIVAEQLNIDGETITEATSLKDDLGADSLDLFSIVMAIEEAYDIEIPSEDLNSVSNVGEIIEYLKSRGLEEA